MNSPSQPDSQSGPTLVTGSPLKMPIAMPVEMLVGLMVPPLLLGLLTARALSDGLTQLGLISEQIFSGERLPNLNMPPSPTGSTD